MIEEGFTFQSNIIWVYNFCDQDIEATTGASKARSWRSNPEGEEEVSSRIPPPSRTQTSQRGRRYFVWDQSWSWSLLHIRLKGHSLFPSYNGSFPQANSTPTRGWARRGTTRTWRWGTTRRGRTWWSMIMTRSPTSTARTPCLSRLNCHTYSCRMVI